MVLYLTWRAVFTMPTDGWNEVAGWALLAIEAAPILPLLVRTFTLWRVDAVPPPRAGVNQVYGPTVVFVPTYNEPLAVLGPTVAAATRLQPAHETWVLDDGDRPWVREMCAAYGARYVQREEHQHAKAGNINHALDLMRLEGNACEFIYILDCDHVPLEGLLHETLGWFDDPSVALVQAPQAYFNETAFDSDGYSGEQGIFFHVLMVSRSNENADPPWCGSTSAVRRSAIEEVGGIATESITEDLHTTLKLLKLGWRSVYHHQVLAVGLAPDTPEQYLIQRRRWALGAMQVYVVEKLWRPKRWLTLRNQLEYITAAFWWFEGAITAAAVILPAAVLISGVQPVRVSPLVYALMVSLEVGLRMFGANLLYRGYIRWRHALELRVLRIPIGIASLWWLLTRRELEFEVTPKGASVQRRLGRVPGILYGLAAAVGAVLVYGALTLFLALPWPSSRVSTLTGGFWLVWAEAMLLMGIARIRDPAFLTSRRVAHRFNVNAQVDVDGARGSLENISTTGVELAFDSPPPTGPVMVRLPGNPATAMVTVRTSDRRGAYRVADGDYNGIRRLTDWIFFTPPDPGHTIPAGLPAAAVLGDDFGAPAPHGPPPARRNDIQGLRALAVALVIAAHLGIARLSGGFVGVDVFFVISGFLITGLMVREFVAEGQIRLRDFYTRRAQRILPAATLVALAILIATGMTQTASRVHDFRIDALWSTGFLQNIHLIKQATDYFASTTASPFQHYWSLSVEEQFYVVWPVMLILLIRAVSRKAMLIVVGVIAALSLATSIALTATAPQQAYFSTYTRAFELGLGALLAIAASGAIRIPTWFAWIGGASALIVIVCCALWMPTAGFPGWHALIPTLAAAALLTAGMQRQVGLNWLLGLRPFQWLGNISYGLYLWHFPIIQVGGPLVPTSWSTPARDGLLVGLSLVAADLTYRLVETPLLRRRATTFRGWRPLAWWPVAAISVVGVAVGSSAYATHREAVAQQHAGAWYAAHSSICVARSTASGATPTAMEITSELNCSHALAVRGAPVPPGVDPQQMVTDGFERGAFCWDHSSSVAVIVPCAVNQVTSRPTMVLIGDSHMGQWLPAFQSMAARLGYNFQPYVRPGCPIWSLQTYVGGTNGNDPACGAYRTATLNAVARTHPAIVVVTSILDARAGDPSDGVGNGWRTGVLATVPHLRGLGARVVVLADTPVRPSPVPTCLGSSGGGLANCELTRSALSIGADQWLGQQVSGAGLLWVDPSALVCVDTFCPAASDDIGMYSDASHITRTWSVHVSAALQQLLAARGVFGRS